LITSLGACTISTPFFRAALTAASSFGAISDTRFAAPLQVCVSHMSQMMIAVSFGDQATEDVDSPRRS
jgi:hypothetical protein